MSHILQYDLHARQSDTFIFSPEFSEDDGTPLDLTDASVEFAFAVVKGRSPSFKYDEAPYVTTSGATVNIEIPVEETRTWRHRRYFYELTITLADGERFTPVEGRLIVGEDFVP